MPITAMAIHEPARSKPSYFIVPTSNSRTRKGVIEITQSCGNGTFPIHGLKRECPFLFLAKTT